MISYLQYTTSDHEIFFFTFNSCFLILDLESNLGLNTVWTHLEIHKLNKTLSISHHFVTFAHIFLNFTKNFATLNETDLIFVSTLLFITLFVLQTFALKMRYHVGSEKFHNGSIYKPKMIFHKWSACPLTFSWWDLCQSQLCYHMITCQGPKC